MPGFAVEAEWELKALRGLVWVEVEPGDVLEHDPANPMTYRKSSGRCSALVAGVVSTDPGLVLGTEFLHAFSSLSPPLDPTTADMEFEAAHEIELPSSASALPPSPITHYLSSTPHSPLSTPHWLYLPSPLEWCIAFKEGGDEDTLCARWYIAVREDMMIRRQVPWMLRTALLNYFLVVLLAVSVGADVIELGVDRMIPLSGDGVSNGFDIGRCGVVDPGWWWADPEIIFASADGPLISAECQILAGTAYREENPWQVGEQLMPFNSHLTRPADNT
jgi:hypothetical protein